MTKVVDAARVGIAATMMAVLALAYSPLAAAHEGEWVTEEDGTQNWYTHLHDPWEDEGPSPLSGPPDGEGHWAHCFLSYERPGPYFYEAEDLPASLADWGDGDDFLDTITTCQYGDPATDFIRVRVDVDKQWKWDEDGNVSQTGTPDIVVRNQTLLVGSENLDAGTLRGATNAEWEGSQSQCTRCGAIVAVYCHAVRVDGVDESCGTDEAHDVGDLMMPYREGWWYPEDHWPGGTLGGLEGEGLVLDSSAEESSVRCRFAQGTVNGSDYVARLEADGETGGATWDPGDGSPTEDGAAIEHTYGGPGPWTASVTTNGGVTCEVVVDFLNPDHGWKPGDDGDGITPPGSGDPGDEVCAVWDVPCWLRKLFIPSGDQMQESWDGLYGTVQTRWPGGPVVWVVDEAGNLDDAVGDGLSEHESNQGASSDFPVEGQACDPGFTFPVGEEDVGVPLLDNCATSGEDPLGEVASLVRTLSTVLIVVGAVFVIRRIVVGTTGAEA